uniref:Ribosomal protein S16 n=2 Tax=Colpodellida TaxID=877183 RepID=D9IXM6_9ALVE|nr:ribosomal protein S16 [Chromerida sp. RM11]ADJ66593.1 ribosomal protein S16 [Chromerida sp. RM11]
MHKLRFQRLGRTYSPAYRLVAIASRYPRSSAGRAFLGNYQPMHGTTISVHMNQTLKYLKLGSQFSSNSLRPVLQYLKFKSQLVKN